MSEAINKQCIRIVKPDIVILAKIFKARLMADKSWHKDIKILARDNKYTGVIQHMQFPCIFDMPCMGDDLDAQGNKRIMNSELTPGVVTIIRDAASNYFGIFFGNVLSYIIKEPNDIFYKDTKQKNIAKKSEALKRYKPLYISYNPYE